MKQALFADQRASSGSISMPDSGSGFPFSRFVTVLLASLTYGWAASQSRFFLAVVIESLLHPDDVAIPDE